MSEVFPRPKKPTQKLSKRWFILLGVALLYVAIGLVYFNVKNFEECFNNCTMGQMLPVVLLPLGLVVIVGLILFEPMRGGALAKILTHRRTKLVSVRQRIILY